MVLFGVVVVLLCISLGLSYLSLRSDVKKHKHVEEVKKKLAKGKVLFYKPRG